MPEVKHFFGLKINATFMKCNIVLTQLFKAVGKVFQKKLIKDIAKVVEKKVSELF